MILSKNIYPKDFSLLRYKIFFTIILIELSFSILILPVVSLVLISNYTMLTSMGKLQDCLIYMTTMLMWVGVGGIFFIPRYNFEQMRIILNKKKLIISQKNLNIALDLKRIRWTRACVFNPLLLNYLLCGSKNKNGICFLISSHIKVAEQKIVFFPLTNSELSIVQEQLNSINCKRIQCPLIFAGLIILLPSIGTVLFSILGSIFHSDITTFCFSILGYFIFTILSWLCHSFYYHSKVK